MSQEDNRWMQRFNNYSKALSQLRKFIAKGELNEFEEQGLIQAFEYTYELAWITIKDYFETQGEININGSRDSFRLAFRRGIIEEGELWMEMVKSRTLTSHTYNEEIARQIAFDITEKYYPEFEKLHNRLFSLQEKNI